jgi:Zn-finger nucleic acid-binding protein
MICSECNASFVASIAQGKKSRQCPYCKGKRLVRSEFERILERSNTYGSPDRPASVNVGKHRDDQEDKYYDKLYESQYYNYSGYEQCCYGYQW